MTYSKAYTTCTQGSDASCQETGYTDACCAYYEWVKDIPAFPCNSSCLAIRNLNSVVGLPTSSTEAAIYTCMSKTTWADYKQLTSNLLETGDTFSYADKKYTGGIIKTFCAGANALAVGAMAALAITASSF